MMRLPICLFLMVVIIITWMILILRVILHRSYVHSSIDNISSKSFYDSKHDRQLLYGWILKEPDINADNLTQYNTSWSGAIIRR